MSVRLRSCLRCGGDLARDPDEQEWACLQCGARIYDQEPLPYAGKGRPPAHGGQLL